MASVNRPTDLKAKEGDVNRKLQFYGIYSAFQNGKAPSNKQIDVALNSLLASDALNKPSPKLSSEGKGLIKDLRDVVEQAKILLLSKNEGNLLQDFLWQTQQISAGNDQLPGAPVDKATAQQHGNEALEGLRTLGTLILSNGQFRKLLSDATILIRSIAGDAAQAAATRVNPSEDRLAQIDHPADDNTWHEVPDLSPSNLRGQAREAYNQNKTFNRGNVQNAVNDAAQNANNTGSSDPVEAADIARQQHQQGTGSDVDAAAGMTTLQSHAKGSIPQETQDRARDVANATKDRTKTYVTGKFPAERREQTVYRLKKMIVEIQGHQDYQQAIETLLNLAETYGGHGLNVSQQGAGAVKGAHADNALTTAETDLRTLIERFANSTSADDLFESINTIYRDAEKDPELKNWFKNLDAYVRKCLTEQGFVLQDSSTDEWNQIYDRGQFLLRDRYKNHTDRIIDEFKFMADQFDQDPQNKRFATSLNKLFNDLGNDENGKPVFKKHLLSDLSTVILPLAFENIRYIPIPRIEYSDKMIDAVVENLIVESDNLMPNSLEIQSDNHFVWGRKTVTSTRKNKVVLAVSGCQMDLRDVSYYVKRKEGFPSITDKGVMDIFMGGSGFSFKVGLETADSKDRQHFFKVNTVAVEVKNLKLKIKQSSHKLLLAIAKPILLSVVRPAIQKLLEKQIRDSIHQADGIAYEINKEAQRAADAAKNDPENAQSIYSHYVKAAQQKMNKTKGKAESTAANTKVNVAMTQQDSIFQDIKLPGGISSKATDYKKLAGEGDKWESSVFSIGTAPESTNIPLVAGPSRKAHNASGGGVRGPQNIEHGQTAFGQQPSLTKDFNGARTGLDPGMGGNSASDATTTQGFSNQVNQAFDGSHGSNDFHLKGNGNGRGQTMLGGNNPVLTGNA